MSEKSVSGLFLSGAPGVGQVKRIIQGEATSVALKPNAWRKVSGSLYVKPIPDDFTGEENSLSDWQPGAKKPAYEGAYLRDLAEGQATSVWSDGKWTRDGFFASDVQDALWRGIPTVVKFR